MNLDGFLQEPSAVLAGKGGFECHKDGPASHTDLDNITGLLPCGLRHG